MLTSCLGWEHFLTLREIDDRIKKKKRKRKAVQRLFFCISFFKRRHSYVVHWHVFLGDRKMQSCVVDLCISVAPYSCIFLPLSSQVWYFSAPECLLVPSQFFWFGHTCGVSDCSVEAEQPKLFSQLISWKKKQAETAFGQRDLQNCHTKKT